jgi:hypothetical protein
MRPFWKFAKPEGPGFGINKNFYLTVLSSRPVLPPIRSVANPKAEHGAVEGFAVPLVDSKDQTLLEAPMTRGRYAIASKDRKTVLKLMVMNADEAGFSPESIARSSLAAKLEPEALTRIRSTWFMLQLLVESHDPEVYPSLDFLLNIATRLGLLTDGVVADPVAERYLLPHRILNQPRVSNEVDARDHVAIHSRPEGNDWHLYTKGMMKIIRPELEIYGVPTEKQAEAAKMLIGAAQGVFQGFPISNGATIGPFEAREGGLNRGLWEGIPVIELLPPTGRKMSELL